MQEIASKEFRRRSFPTWRSVELGRFSTVEGYLDAMGNEGWTRSVLEEAGENIVLGRPPRSLDLVRLQAQQFCRGTSYWKMREAARSHGLRLCPLEVALALMVQEDHPSEGKLIVGSRLIHRPSPLDPYVLALMNIKGSRSIISLSVGGPITQPWEEIVFVQRAP